MPIREYIIRRLDTRVIRHAADCTQTEVTATPIGRVTSDSRRLATRIARERFPNFAIDLIRVDERKQVAYPADLPRFY